MNTALRRNWTHSVWAWMTGLFNFFTTLVLNLPHFGFVKDDPAAIRYAASKYEDEID